MIPTIEIPVDKAKEAFLAYREQVKKRHSKEDWEIMQGYRALSRGMPVISLTEVFERIGRNTRGFPKLAICRADAQKVYVDVRQTWFPPHHFLRFIMDERWVSDRATRRYIQLPVAQHVQLPRGTWSAMVPLIPPPLRPKHALSNYHVLWEADWKNESPPAPRDPYLLKRLSPNLFAVIASWDLTPLERAVLAGRNVEMS